MTNITQSEVKQEALERKVKKLVDEVGVEQAVRTIKNTPTDALARECAEWRE